MDPVQFFATSRLLIVAGKGGVGKTTVTAALARAAGSLGQRVLVIEVEGKSGLPGLLGVEDELSYDEQVLASGLGPGGTGEIRGRTITPARALVDYFQERGLRRLSNRLVRHGVLDIVATAAPGIDDILVLGKVKQLERSGDADLLVLDAPAAGHAITFLQSARALLDAVKVGPINAQAKDVMELLSDPARCQVLLVTLPEETPVNEVVDTAFALEDRVGVSLTPVVVNGCYQEREGLDADPASVAAASGITLDGSDLAALSAAARFRAERLDLQREQLGRLAERLPLPQLQLPFRFTAGLGPDEVIGLADELLRGIAGLAA
ncbi:MAG TPA: ArsA-related P-loop ATPase [Acidimicrobiales bacterium]